MSILDPSFKWTPSASTDIRETWRKYGWKPTSDAQRRAQQQPKSAKPHKPSNVRDIKRKSA